MAMSKRDEIILPFKQELADSCMSGDDADEDSLSRGTGLLPSISVSVEMTDTLSSSADSNDKEAFTQVFVKEEAHSEEETAQMGSYRGFYSYAVGASFGEGFIPHGINCPTSRLNRVSTCRGLGLRQSPVWPTQAFTASVLNNSKKQMEERLYTCDVCLETFAHVSSLNIHKQVHKPFTCPQCGKNFTFVSNLKQHLRNHAGDLPYVCKVCNKGFMFQCRLEQHETIHIGNKSFKCTECGKGFTRKSILKTHKMSHSGLKSFRCIECGKGFTLRSHLNRHVKTHTGEKPFFCAECGKNFTDKSNFIRHMKRHSNTDVLTCDECGTNFSDRSYYSRHRKKHVKRKEALALAETHAEVIKTAKDCIKTVNQTVNYNTIIHPILNPNKGNARLKTGEGNKLLRTTCKTLIDNLRKASKCTSQTSRAVADRPLNKTGVNSNPLHEDSLDKLGVTDLENVSKCRTSISTDRVDADDLKINFFSNIMRAVMCKDEPASSEDEENDGRIAKDGESDTTEYPMPLDMRINPT